MKKPTWLPDAVAEWWAYAFVALTAFLLGMLCGCGNNAAWMRELGLLAFLGQPQGDDGDDGLDGSDGAEGMDGLDCWDLRGDGHCDGQDWNGPQGVPDGICDAWDCQGVPGRDGADGAVGPSGPAGPMGPAGPIGQANGPPFGNGPDGNGPPGHP